MTYKVVLLSFSEKTEWGPLCLHANVKVGILEQWIPNCFSIVIMVVRIMQIEKLNTTSHCVNIKKKLQRYQISCMVRHVSQNVTHLAGVLKVDVQSL